MLKRIDAEDKTAGGIIIPDTAKEKPSQGEIIAVGPGGRDEAGKLIPIDVKVGDRVLFGKWSGTEVKLDGQELLIMKESDIMGVLTDVPAAKKKAASALARSLILSSRRSRRLEGRGLQSKSHPSGIRPVARTWDLGIRRSLCQPRKSNSASMPAIACCAVSTFSTMRSR